MMTTKYWIPVLLFTTLLLMLTSGTIYIYTVTTYSTVQVQTTATTIISTKLSPPGNIDTFTEYEISTIYLDTLTLTVSVPKPNIQVGVTTVTYYVTTYIVPTGTISTDTVTITNQDKEITTSVVNLGTTSTNVETSKITSTVIAAASTATKYTTITITYTTFTYTYTTVTLLSTSVIYSSHVATHYVSSYVYTSTDVQTIYVHPVTTSYSTIFIYNFITTTIIITQTSALDNSDVETFYTTLIYSQIVEPDTTKVTLYTTITSTHYVEKFAAGPIVPKINVFWGQFLIYILAMFIAINAKRWSK